MLPFKRKEKFDKYSIRGMIYAGIAVFGIGYELIFSKEIRPFLIIGYSIVFIVGIIYVWYIKPYKQNQ